MGFGIRNSKKRHNAADKLSMREFCCSHQVISHVCQYVRLF
jgi:DNA-directed RNA polymerase subunit N (RpoN/RPB10)